MSSVLHILEHISLSSLETESLLDVQIFMVLAHSSSFCCKGVKHHRWIDEILLQTLKPSIQLLKPHQLSSIFGQTERKHDFITLTTVNIFDSCASQSLKCYEINMAGNLWAVYLLLQAECDVRSYQQFEIKVLKKKYDVWEEDKKQEAGSTVTLNVYANKNKRAITLTSDLKLAVFSGAEHRMSQAEPWELLSELRQEIVCNEAYNSGQDVQDEAQSRLWIKRNEEHHNKHNKMTFFH